MTVINAYIFQPDAGEEDVGARGYLRWVPTRGHVSDEGIVLPLPFTVMLVDGQATMDAAPSTADWVWSVTYRLLGILHYTRYYAVPALGPLDLDELVEVDPATLVPTAPDPEPAWFAYVDAIAAGQVGVVHVVTGSEARLPFGTVLWIGGTTQPGNMAEVTDIWFKSAA